MYALHSSFKLNARPFVGSPVHPLIWIRSAQLICRRRSGRPQDPGHCYTSSAARVGGGSERANGNESGGGRRIERDMRCAPPGICLHTLHKRSLPLKKTPFAGMPRIREAPSSSGMTAAHTHQGLSRSSNHALLLQRIEDVLPVAGVVQCVHGLLEHRPEAITLPATGMLDHALDDEVTEAVVHHLLQRRIRVADIADNLVHQSAPLVLQLRGMLSDGSNFQRLLHDIAGALVLGEFNDVVLHHTHDPALIVHAAML
mmetsp:Transcript_78374/g.227445  ORF Transcript_78374/g.227445 Transcript_78374/m.227445 type:complete len:257 (+) Transcript_78374:283-1053(+)